MYAWGQGELSHERDGSTPNGENRDQCHPGSNAAFEVPVRRSPTLATSGTLVPVTRQFRTDLDSSTTDCPGSFGKSCGVGNVQYASV
jgi:hypothetical protein